MKAAAGSGNTAIAVRGSKSAAFITQKKVPVRKILFHLQTFYYLLIPADSCRIDSLTLLP